MNESIKTCKESKQYIYRIFVYTVSYRIVSYGGIVGTGTRYIICTVEDVTIVISMVTVIPPTFVYVTFGLFL